MSPVQQKCVHTKTLFTTTREFGGQTETGTNGQPSDAAWNPCKNYDDDGQKKTPR